MRFYRILPLLLVVLTAVASEAFAQLQFVDEKKAVRSAVGAAVVRDTFTYKNIGAAAVTILGADVGCGCTIANITKGDILPGQTGMVEVAVDLKDKSGKVLNTVTVHTAESGGQKLYALALEVDVTPEISITPRLLFWKSSDSRDPRVVMISNRGERVMTIERVEVVDAARAISVRQEQEGDDLFLTVTPVASTGSDAAVIKAYIDISGEKRLLVCHVHVY